jgi:hypothetical protein
MIEKYENLSWRRQTSRTIPRVTRNLSSRSSSISPPAQVHLPDGTITSRLTFILRLQEHGPCLLRNYIQTKNQWTHYIFTTINWEVHAEVLKQHHKQRIHFTKMIHEVLPTNYHLHRGEPHRQKCPSCATVKEDRDHIIR